MNYLEKRRRHKVKKQLRLKKPYLMGPQLDQEVDRVLGISDSGRMDWAAIKKVEISDYPTPESVTPDLVTEVAEQFSTRPYRLYWFFTQKVTKLQASGSSKNDYLAVLKEVAANTLTKELSDEEKHTAALFWSQFAGIPATKNQIDRAIFLGEL